MLKLISSLKKFLMWPLENFKLHVWLTYVYCTALLQYYVSDSFYYFIYIYIFFITTFFCGGGFFIHLPRPPSPTPFFPFSLLAI